MQLNVKVSKRSLITAGFRQLSTDIPLRVAFNISFKHLL